tara:strand:- start:289 stop:450 length:162 start_codon:yes stop_codon:yes gene_type:complete
MGQTMLARTYNNIEKHTDLYIVDYDRRTPELAVSLMHPAIHMKQATNTNKIEK